MTENELNAVYRELEVRTASIARYIDEMNLTFTVGFYGGHYCRNEKGEYVRNCYPIPVISVDGLCDVEVGLDVVSVSAKLKREAALAFDYAKLSNRKFEVYGVQDYLTDYYAEGDTADKLKANIESSREREIGFQFSLGKNADAKEVAETVKFVQANGFYY